MATYAQIIQRLQRWSEDYGTTFQTALDDAIAHAELMISRDLNVDQMRFWTTIAVAAGDYILNKPATATAIRQITYTTAAGVVTTLEFRRHEYIVDYAPTPGVLADRAPPKFWDNYDQLDTTTGLATPRIYIGPSADQAYTLNAECEGAIKGLSSSNTTTWLSLYKEDFLFTAIIKWGAKFEHESPMISEWDKAYADGLTGMQAEVARVRSDATSVQRVA